jgi:hypothetical protein
MPTGVAFPDKQHCELAYGVGNCVAGPDGTWIGNVIAPPKPQLPAVPPLVSFPDQQSCEVAFGAGNCIQGLYGDWFSAEAYQASGLSSLTQGTDWDPISWAQSALSDLTGVFGPVERWVIKQIAKAASLIENDIDKVWTWLYARFGGIENTISHLAGEINSVVGSLGGDISKVLDSARHDIAAAVDAGVHKAESELSTVESEAVHLGHDAEHYTDTAIAAFEKDVLRPVENELRRLIHDAESEADHAWHVWYKDIWAPALHDLREAEHNAAKAVYFIDHSALDAIHLIDECWDWLLAFARNPIKELESMPGQVARALPGVWTLAANEPATSEIDKVIDWLNKELPNE